MPKNHNKKNEEKKNQNESRIFETASKAFTGTLANEIGKFLINAAESALPPLVRQVVPLTATVGAIISHSVQSGTKRKAESGSAEEIEFGEKEKLKWLVEAIENANLDVVRFILENEPNLVKEKLKNDCFAEEDDEDDKRAYCVKEGSSISELARKVRDSLQKYKNIEKIIELIEEAKGKIRDLDRKEVDINHEKQSLTLGSELQSKMVGDTSDDEWELMDIPEYIVVNSGNSTPKSTLHSPLVTCGGQAYSQS